MERWSVKAQLLLDWSCAHEWSVCCLRTQCLKTVWRSRWLVTSQSTYRLERKLTYCLAKGLPLFIFCQIQRNRRRNCFATLSFTAQGRSSGVYKRLTIGPEPWNSELQSNSCVCYVVTRSTSPPGKYWAPSPAFIHWKSLFCQIRNLKHFLNIGGKMGMVICCGNAKKQTFKTQEIPVVWNRQLDDANTGTGGY